MAEIRKQALLASGVQIEGLAQGSGSEAPAPKKVVYGSRKKKGLIVKGASPAPDSRPRTPEPVASSTVPAPAFDEPQVPADDAPKDDWDASSEEESSKNGISKEVKDSWDASSDEETEKDRPEPRKGK